MANEADDSAELDSVEDDGDEGSGEEIQESVKEADDSTVESDPYIRA